MAFYYLLGWPWSHGRLQPAVYWSIKHKLGTEQFLWFYRETACTEPGNGSHLMPAAWLGDTSKHSLVSSDRPDQSASLTSGLSPQRKGSNLSASLANCRSSLTFQWWSPENFSPGIKIFFRIMLEMRSWDQGQDCPAIFTSVTGLERGEISLCVVVVGSCSSVVVE